jgi:predicted DNA-binding protein (UPF0251 family)
MPRPRRCRRVCYQPNTTYFKPAGIQIIDLEERLLTVDQYEAIRLKDLLGLEQEAAAKKMNISQPTFHRLIIEARKIIADALVNGKAIKIQGGPYRMIQTEEQSSHGIHGYRVPATICVCPSCGYQEPKQQGVTCSSKKCPKCNSPLIRGE